MTELVRWDPFDRPSLRNAMDRLFEDAFITPRWLTPFRESLLDGFTLDVIENDDTLTVKASVPGYKAEEVNVTVVDNVLTLKGEKTTERKEEKDNYLLRERHFGALHRSLRLPVLVQGDKAHAEFEDGVLTLTLPKAEAVKPKQIKVYPKTNGK